MYSGVWQRVKGAEPMDLCRLARLCREAEADYRHLCSLCGGKSQRCLAALTREAGTTAAAVQGMALLRGLSVPPAGCWREPKLRRGLALAYGRSRELWEAFRAWSGSGEFGYVFLGLARQEEQIGRKLLALIASL